ncbi:MAG: lysophospholipase [Alphaproteobacteria bacterium]|nr:alpha/beta hydrolase [Alphaproteobacteria bacterium]MDE2111842.1 lysophospholipase [Alphaproteobacteria bacterium]MDE2493582.1 lysophospholipase [Alphaproteobacteria bacterium]
MGKAVVVLASILMVACTLGACAPVVAPLGLTNDMPEVTSDFFLTRDGLRLPLRHWNAEHPKAIIVALHGMSDYSEAFDMPAPYWAQHGITTYAYDQRSFGKAPHPGIWPGGRALRDDLADCIAAVRRRNPGLPIFALGESMGGAVVLSAMADPKPPRVDGVILVAPAVWSRDDMPLSYRVALWLAAHVAPSLELSGNGLHIWPSNNIEMLRKLSRDPLFQKHTRADAVWGLVNLMDAARNAPLHLPADTPPILFLFGDKDQIVPRAPTEAVAKELGKRAEINEYPDGYHMLLRDLDGPSIWKDIVTWIDKVSRGPTA